MPGEQARGPRPERLSGEIPTASRAWLGVTEQQGSVLQDLLRGSVRLRGGITVGVAALTEFLRALWGDVQDDPDAAEGAGGGVLAHPARAEYLLATHAEISSGRSRHPAGGLLSFLS